MSIRPLSLIICASLTFLALPAAGAAAQNLADVNDPIYRTLEEWESLRYIASLPYLQPYAPQRVIVALQQAAGERPFAHGLAAPPAVRRDALALLGKLRDGNRPVGGSFYTQSRFARYKSADDEYHGLYIPGIEVVWQVGPLLQFHGRFGETFIDYADGPARPYREWESQEWIADSSGKVEPFGRDMYQNHQLVTNMALGTAELYFQTGMSRSSFGPIHDDGIFLSNEAPGSAQFILSWDRPVMTGQLLYRPISASTHGGSGREPDKHLMFHSIQYRPLPWLELNFNEAVVYGGYLNPSYFVPANSFFLTQGLVGFDGNALLGLQGLFKPFPGLEIPIAVNMDDLHWSDMVRGDWDTKYKLAAQAAVDWYPAAQNVPVLSRAMVDYTAVMPYMYSHWDEDPTPTVGELNYSNYTHLGHNMATGLHPNSDRIRAILETRPLPGLSLNFTAENIRHGNASTGILAENPAAGVGTGTVFDPGYQGSTPTFQRPFEDPTGQPYTRFLTQEVIEKVRHLGVTANYRLPIDGLFAEGRRIPDIRLEVGYLFEHMLNADLVEGNERVGHFIDVNLTAKY